MTLEPYSPGLEGIVAGLSSICDIDEEKGGLHYRGYPIEVLADSASYEEVCYLLLAGHLPTPSELSTFSEQLATSRKLPDGLITLLHTIPDTVHPMDVLRTAVSYLGMMDPDTSDFSDTANFRKALRLLAQTPMILASHYRISKGKPLIDPNPELSQAQQILYYILGQCPKKEVARALEGSLILYAEHEFNSSTFVARVTASSLSDMHSAVTSAIGSLKGSLHGGANEAVMQMLLQIGAPEHAESWVMERLNRKERIMGFGHRVLKRGDSRSDIIKRYAKKLGKQVKEKKWIEISEIIERLLLLKKGMYPNLDFYTASAYYMMGIPIPLYTPIFVCSRMAGWCAHVMEQHSQNRLIRPRSRYIGPERRSFVPLSRRE